MRHSTNRRQGFTLVEVLVVMAILVLLAGLVAPRILGSKKKADISAAETQIGAFKGALERYALDMNDFPTSEQGLEVLVKEPDTDKESDSGTGRWDGPYLTGDDLPVDPWGNDYQYEFPATHSKTKEYEIWSYGPDGEDDTEDDIVSWTKSSEEGGEFSDKEGKSGGNSSTMSKEAGSDR